MRAPLVLVAAAALAILIAVWCAVATRDMRPAPVTIADAPDAHSAAAPGDEPLARSEAPVAREPGASQPVADVAIEDHARVPVVEPSSPATLSSDRKLRIRVCDAHDPSRALEAVVVGVVDLYDEREAVTRTSNDTFTTATMRPDVYVVTARARDHLSAHQLVGTGEGTKDVVVSLDRCDAIQVHWRATDGSPIVQAFDRAAVGAALPQLELAAVATREVPAELASAFEANVGAVLIHHFPPARQISADGRPIPANPEAQDPRSSDVIGALQPQIAPPFYVSAWMNGVFVDSRRIESGMAEVTFSCELPELSRRSATLKVHVVDADTDKSLTVAQVLVEQQGFARVGGGVDADGRIQLVSLRSGAADVWIEAPGRAKIREHVILRASAVTDLGDVRLEAPIKVSARVVDEQGTLLPSVPLEFTPLDDRLEPIAGAPPREITTAASGIATLDADVRRARYTVRFADNVEQFAAVPIIVDARSGSAEGELVLSVARKVSIAIQPPPEAGAFVRITTSSGVLARRKKVGEAGRVVVSLAPGRYDLALVENGVARVLKSFDIGADWLLLAVDR
jgi:CBS domain-containing protein